MLMLLILEILIMLEITCCLQSAKQSNYAQNNNRTILKDHRIGFNILIKKNWYKLVQIHISKERHLIAHNTYIPLCI
jgi:hypothetical protein